MEFGEKLQELRKNRCLTQEELAEALYVSRTAVSKWESGRGYPSIDSLKEISNYFSVSIDDLLSGEKLISIAEKENKTNIRNMCNLLFGIVDVFSFLLIILPLYSKTSDGYIYSVNLFAYTETAAFNRFIYWGMFIALVLLGILKILFTQLKIVKSQKILTVCSILIGVAAVLLLALAREPYAVVVMFLLTVIKGLLLFRYVRAE
ncbi:MAG: helix-turn-helix transcriptional regulator [Ruminococcaceae bacterium]|nr:helix-turn-helix transcriptional regulator [Oscillospiraceae bacterium]